MGVAMNMTMFGAVIVIMAAAVSFAGLQDLMSRRISNLFPIFIIVLFLAAHIIAGWQVDVWKNLISFLVVLVIGALLFKYGIMGGGDVKLWAAVALWFKPSQLPLLILCITLAGGALALVSIIRRLIRKNAISTQNGGAVPYGVAIAIGTIITVSLGGVGVTQDARRGPAYQDINASLMKTVSRSDAVNQ